MDKKYIPLFFAVLTLCVLTSAEAWAAPGAGGNLPYEKWVCQK